MNYENYFFSYLEELDKYLPTFSEHYKFTCYYCYYDHVINSQRNSIICKEILSVNKKLCCLEKTGF